MKAINHYVVVEKIKEAPKKIAGLELTEDQNKMLNKRDELLETCRHRRKHLLVSMKIPTTDTGQP